MQLKIHTMVSARLLQAGLRVLHVPDMLKPTKEMEQLSYMIFPDLIEVREYLAKNA